MQFVNPLFLSALAAIAIPILIHLFNFRQFKKVYFTNVAFLREIQQETKKQSRLKQLLILLARILTIIALVFAFAQPYIPAPGQVRKNSGKKAVSIYIDNSFSMETLATEGRLIDAAKKKAVEIASAYAPSDLFQLMNNDFEGRMHRFTDRDQFLRLVEEMQISPVSRPINEVILRQNELKKEAREANMDVYVISDFQKSTADFSQAQPDTSIAWYLVPVEASRTANLFIDTLYFSSPVHQTGQTSNLHVRIFNTGSEPLEKIPIKLTINGTQKSLANFAVAPGTDTEVILPFTENKAGVQYGQVEISDYPIVHDDLFYFSYRIMPALKVMAISDDKPDPYLNALFGADSSILFTNPPIRQVVYNELFNQSLILLNAPSEISTGLSQELQRFVENGGHLGIFPPANIKSGTISEFFRIFGVDLVTSPDTTRQRIDRINTENELFSGVFETGTSGRVNLPENLDLPVVTRHYPVRTTGTNSLTESLLSMQNNRPFLSMISYGKGKVYLFASPLQPEWSNFPRHAIFVPTLFNMALFSQQSYPLSYIAGENAQIPIPADSVSETAMFRLRQVKGSFEVIPGVVRTGSGLAIQTFDQIKTAGFFQLLSGEREITGLAFNFDRKESKLELFSAGELKEQLRKFRGNAISVLGEKNRPLARQIEEINQGTPLWKLFIILALIFIAAEIALIRHLRI